MVDLRGRRYGIELSETRMRIVGRSYTPGRSSVDTILDVDLDRFEKDVIDRNADLFLAVSESDTIIKKIAIPPDKNLDPDKLAQFELSASLLDAADRYYMESFSINETSDRLAIAYNRDLVDRKVALLRELFGRPSGFKVRSWAMASGYINFCRRAGGKLICLIDIGEDQTSYCLLKDNSPVDIGSTVKYKNSESGPGSVSKGFILDLAATMQYRLVGVSGPGRSVPLSLIVLTGSQAGPELASEIEDALGTRTVFPEMKTELFSRDAIATAEKHLVGLGLTAEF